MCVEQVHTGQFRESNNQLYQNEPMVRKNGYNDSTFYPTNFITHFHSGKLLKNID